MKKLCILLAIVVLACAGCMSTNRGTYTIDVRRIEEQGVSVSGYLSASAFARWDRSPYGRKPKLLVEILVRSLLPGIAAERYSIQDISFTSFEASSNPGLWGAVVVGDEEVSRMLSSKIGRRVEGEFSFTEARLVGVPTERPYSP